MSLYAVSVVQNEADIIRESISWACRFFKRIWIWDLGSTDGTWDVLKDLQSEQVVCSRREGLPFTSSLKGRVFAEARPEIEDGAWVYILDADEFLATDPRPVLEAAAAEGSDMVGAWQANFLPTPTDVQAIARSGEAAWAQTPLVERFRHYRVEWFEWRFLRATRDLVWDTSGPHSRWSYENGRAPVAARKTLVVRHYRYRSPTQVSARHQTRCTSPAPGYGQFRYSWSDAFEDYARPTRYLCRWSDYDHELRIPSREMLRAVICLWWIRLKNKFYRMVSRHGSADD